MNGRVSDITRKLHAPPVTHHNAVFFLVRVFRKTCFHERLTSISPRLARTTVENVRVRIVSDESYNSHCISHNAE